MAISKTPNPPPKYKASQCGKSDPNTASQSDSSKDCTHSKGVNQLGAMSHSLNRLFFFSRCCYRRRAVYSASQFLLYCQFCPVSSGQFCFLCWSIESPTTFWSRLKVCRSLRHKYKKKQILVQIQIQLEAHWPHETGRTNQRISAAVRRQ